MICESNTLNEIELTILYSQLLLNSKLLSLIENQSIAEPIKIFKASNEALAIFHPKKNSLFFSATTDPESALEIFIHLKASYIVKIIEGADELINKIADYLRSLSKKYNVTKMLVMSKEMSGSVMPISSEFEFLQGQELNDFEAHVLVDKFSTERLNTTLDESEAKKLLLSSTREFVGVKVNGEVVSIAAWIREIHGYRCLSYVYTDEKYRGRGFSQLLLSKLLRDICGKYKGAFLFVETSNTPALNLYSKFGFKDAGLLSQLKLT